MRAPRSASNGAPLGGGAGAVAGGGAVAGAGPVGVMVELDPDVGGATGTFVDELGVVVAGDATVGTVDEDVVVAPTSGATTVGTSLSLREAHVAVLPVQLPALAARSCFKND